MSLRLVLAPTVVKVTGNSHPCPLNRGLHLIFGLCAHVELIDIGFIFQRVLQLTQGFHTLVRRLSRSFVRIEQLVACFSGCSAKRYKALPAASSAAGS